MQSTDTLYTLEGTLAHSCAEWMLHYYRDLSIPVLPFDEFKQKVVDTMPVELMDICLKCTDHDFDFWGMMETVHESYVSQVIGDWLAAKQNHPDAELLIEARIELSTYVPGGFGSSDAVLIYGPVLTVYDLKYGQGVKVMAPNNKQMMLYALGALCGPGELHDIDTVGMCIIQPRLHHYSAWSIGALQLIQWGRDTLRPLAEKAYSGKGDVVPGEHCKFCKVAHQCRALAAMTEAVSARAQEPQLLSMEEIAGLLPKFDTIKSWMAKVEQYALDSLMNGTDVPGFKVVEGRSLRSISDPQAAMQTLKDAGFEESFYLREPELRSISDLEKLLRRKGFQELLGQYVEKPQGKPTLAPEDDPRPAFTKEDPFKDINL